ncbi:hypothetical protein ACJX0J_016895 [Zea mays]
MIDQLSKSSEFMLGLLLESGDSIMIRGIINPCVGEINAKMMDIDIFINYFDVLEDIDSKDVNKSTTKLTAPPRSGESHIFTTLGFMRDDLIINTMLDFTNHFAIYLIKISDLVLGLQSVLEFDANSIWVTFDKQDTYEDEDSFAMEVDYDDEDFHDTLALDEVSEALDTKKKMKHMESSKDYTTI